MPTSRRPSTPAPLTTKTHDRGGSDAIANVDYVNGTLAAESAAHFVGIGIVTTAGDSRRDARPRPAETPVSTAFTPRWL